MSQTKPPKQPTFTTLQKRLTVVYNRYIRLRDTWVEDGVRVGKCISCGEHKHISELDAGHFVAANFLAHRYTDQNVNAQCHRCNRFLHGNLIGYYIGMEKKWGEGYAKFLWETRLPRPALDASYREYLERAIIRYTELVREREG